MTTYLFYDGDCGLCHWWVSFTLKRDAKGAIHFCPLQSLSLEDLQKRYGDSLVVLTADGRVLSKSEGVLFLLEELGGIWRSVAAMLRIFPAVLRDLVYDQVAKIRRKVFPKPSGVCPLVPKQAQERFVGAEQAKELNELLQ